MFCFSSLYRGLIPQDQLSTLNIMMWTCILKTWNTRDLNDLKFYISFWHFTRLFTTTLVCVLNFSIDWLIYCKIISKKHNRIKKYEFNFKCKHLFKVKKKSLPNSCIQKSTDHFSVKKFYKQCERWSEHRILWFETQTIMNRISL